MQTEFLLHFQKQHYQLLEGNTRVWVSVPCLLAFQNNWLLCEMDCWTRWIIGLI